MTGSRLLQLVCFCIVEAFVVSGDFCPHVLDRAIRSCVAPVAEYAEALSAAAKTESPSARHANSLDPLSLPTMETQVFRELCTLIRRYNVCVKIPRLQCPKHTTISLIDASYGYLCEEGYQTFIENADCLMKLDQQPAVRDCHNRTLTSITATNSHPDLNTSVKYDRMCEALNYFARCVREPVRLGCGAEAWAIILRVLRDTTHTLMPTCAFDGSRPLVKQPRGVAVTRELSQADVAAAPPSVADRAVAPFASVASSSSLGRVALPSVLVALYSCCRRLFAQ